MFRSLWIAALAMAAFWISASVAQENPDTAPQQQRLISSPAPAQSAHDIAGNVIAALEAIASSIRQWSPKDDRVDGIRKEIREISDLKAQKEMAKWAKFMLFFTGAATTLTAAGAYFVYKTLVETKKSVKLASDLGKKQIRAYLTVSQPQIIQPQIGKQLSAKASFKNSGQSPAYNVTGWCRVVIGRDRFLSLQGKDFDKEIISFANVSGGM